MFDDLLYVDQHIVSTVVFSCQMPGDSNLKVSWETTANFFRDTASVYMQSTLWWRQVSLYVGTCLSGGHFQLGNYSFYR